jgi:hypothetical protein
MTHRIFRARGSPYPEIQIETSHGHGGLNFNFQKSQKILTSMIKQNLFFPISMAFTDDLEDWCRRPKKWSL